MIHVGSDGDERPRQYTRSEIVNLNTYPVPHDHIFFLYIGTCPCFDPDFFASARRRARGYLILREGHLLNVIKGHVNGYRVP